MYSSVLNTFLRRVTVGFRNFDLICGQKLFGNIAFDLVNSWVFSLRQRVKVRDQQNMNIEINTKI